MKSILLKLIVSFMLITLIALEPNAQTPLNLKVFLEGPFNGTVMNTDLNTEGLIPLAQPYNGLPWNYTGTETVASIPNAGIVDWVLVELRESAGDASTATVDKRIHRQAAFLLSNGNIVGLNGSSQLEYPGTPANNLYVIIWHRNHLAIMSSGGLFQILEVYSWDFTDQLSNAYLDGQKTIGSGMFGMISGDSDANGTVEPADINPDWYLDAGKKGYASVDFNLDTQVNNKDKNSFWIPNIGATAHLPAGPFSCGNNLLDARDGQTYNTVQIGTQCWMAENLNFGTMVPGANNMTNNSITEKYCYEDNTANCDTYGGLYQWKEMMEYSTTPGVKGICPAGWHIPTNDEWTVLTDFVGGEPVAGGEMKTTGTIEAGTGLWNDPNTAATNSSGFSALPGGYRLDGGGFTFLGNYGNFWTSTEAITEYVWFRNLFFQYAFVSSAYGVVEANGYSVRCLKDTPPPVWSCGDPITDERDNQTYSTVQIDTQCWMAENLNIGTTIPGATDMANNSIIEKYCNENNTANCDTYGGLYQWNEMMEYSTTPGVQGICPTGWHLPTDAEWTASTSYLGGENIAGGKMKTTGTIEAGTGLWFAPNNGATNSSGFSALPGGYRYGNDLFNAPGGNANFWSSSEYNDNIYNALCRELLTTITNVEGYSIGKGVGFSVRCVKDTPPPVWSCGDPLLDTRDNQTYNTVQIDTQCWMAENLNIGSMTQGGTAMTNNSITEKYCYDNNTTNCDTYGGLYQWKEMMDYSATPGVQGICPAGWHVPADEEWSILTVFLGGESIAGGKMKTTGTIEAGTGLWYDPNTGATNSSGLSALPGGIMLHDGSSTNMGNYANLWSSTEYYPDYAKYRLLYNSHAIVDNYGGYEGYGLNVRCVKGTPPTAWSCGDPLFDTRDNQTYNTVQIDTQCWMAENLNIGTTLPGATDMTNNSIIEKYCYENNTTNCDTSGGLYQWNEMMDYSTTPGVQGICPTGWHLPADAEWTTLTAFLGGESIAGGKMKTTGTIEAGTGLWNAPNTGATNSNGFSALPGGNRYGNGSFYDKGLRAFFWSSTENQPNFSYRRILSYDNTAVNRDYFYENNGFSVRCVKDTPPPVWSCGDPLPDTRDNQTYTTVEIGGQCWMAQNLNIGTLVSVTTEMANNSIIEKYCSDDNEANCNTYGGLYQWNEMMQYVTTPGTQGLCPAAWHIPTQDEWYALTDYLGGEPVAGGKMKATGTIEAGTGLWLTPNTGATNTSGFTAIPGGYRLYGGAFESPGYHSYFWSSNEYDIDFAVDRSLYYNIASVISGTLQHKVAGFSVRCLKGNNIPSNLPPSQPASPNPSDNSQNQSIFAQPSWTCTDPENDPLTYDVYFGTSNPPSLVSSGQTGTSYNPGIVENSTPYYWKIVAHDNHSNTTEGQVWSFTTLSEPFLCGNPLLDTRDNQTYNTVQIGTQCWMAENLNIGTTIPGATEMANNIIIEKYCYNNSAANCDVYGGLYQWNEMMQYNITPGVQGICPTGWHLPTDAEWCTITTDLDATVNCSTAGWSGTNAGGKMKETGTTHWFSPNTGATNSSGFTGLPGGGRTSGGTFSDLGLTGISWSSTENSTTDAWSRGLTYNFANVYRYLGSKGSGFSVRCVKANLSPSQPASPIPSDNTQNQPVNTVISWTCTDPEIDPLTYDIYFGTYGFPALVAFGQTVTSFNLGALAYSTPYSWKIVAHDNHSNTTEGPIWSFTTISSPLQCDNPLLDTRDNQTYTTVQIGTQCWMAENLNIGTMISGANDMANNSIIEKYCYQNNSGNCDTYGGLYQWNEMMNYSTTPGMQGICPAGWHVPTDAEWTTLTTFLGGESIAGGKMKSYGTIEAGTGLWNAPNAGATNESGFTALPGGNRYYFGSFGYLNEAAYFWSSTEYDFYDARYRYLSYYSTNVPRHYVNKTNGFSVRCLQD